MGPINQVGPSLRVDPNAGIRLKFGSSFGISMEYIGLWVLAQPAVLYGVLAQVTELEPTIAVSQNL
jgi:hypothetical protein